MSVRVGEHDLDNDPDCLDGVCADSPQEMDVEKVIFHPSYGKPKPFQNDIAVIKLSKEVEINDYVSLVCLPYMDDQDNYATNRWVLLYSAFITTSRRYIKEEAQIQSNFIKQLLFLFLLLDLVVPPSFKQQGFEKIDTIDKSFKSLVIRICIINIYKIII